MVEMLLIYNAWTRITITSNVVAVASTCQKLQSCGSHSMVCPSHRCESLLLECALYAACAVIVACLSFLGLGQ
jgi:hypothetical protein